MKTEDEAREATCCGPHPTASTLLMFLLGTKPDDYEGARYGKCAASHCMAWRWGTEQKTRTDLVPGDLYPESEATYSVASTTHGYCGLAGKP